MIMLDVLACDARAMFYGASAAIDGLKVKSICRKIEKEKKVKLSVPKKASTENVEENKTKETEPEEVKKEEKKPQTVVPASVISNPDVEKTVIVETEKPIDVENIKHYAEDIASEIEKGIQANVKSFTEADPEMKADIVTDIAQEAVDKVSLSKSEIIFKAFIDKSEEDQSMAIYDAIIKNGDRVLKDLDDVNSQNGSILYDVFVTDVLGLNISEIGKDGLDDIISKHEKFMNLFSTAAHRAITYLRTKHIDEDDSNENILGASKINLEEKIISDEGEATNGLKKHVEFSEGVQSPEAETIKLEAGPNKTNKKSTRRK